ncbi:chromate transporter [Alteribacillus sp. YIM 98480]|uniref:chromate transporter n=1 Tax=Alteribacillus sp. YIM 98480 TaxID=2606599 RepID=UPI00131CA199|nr:chromate transporter [Alteribacillus sp. YIM 98480]
MNWSLHKHIFIAFFRAGMLGYGGGPASIPLVHKEVVENFEWVTEEQFYDILAIGNTLPGPIFTKMAGYIGYRIGGVMGVFNAIIASVIPSVILMISLVGILMTFRSSPFIEGMTQAIAPVVGVMLLTLTYNTLKSTKQRSSWLFVIILTIISIIILELLNIHPAFFIVILLIIGFSYRKKPNTTT